MSTETAIATTDKEMMPTIPVGLGVFFDVAKFEFAQRVARMLAMSSFMPEQFRGENNIGNCVIVLNYAERVKCDPVMLAQNMYVVHGRPGIEAKFLIALVNSSGRYAEPLQWRFEGEGPERKCVCFTHTRSGVILEAEVTWSMVEAEGWNKSKGTMPSKWMTLTDLMFRYRSASFFCNLYCPDLKLGMPTKEELYDVVDLEEDEEAFSYKRDRKTVNPTPLNVTAANKDVAAESQLGPDLDQMKRWSSVIESFDNLEKLTAWGNKNAVTFKKFPDIAKLYAQKLIALQAFPGMALDANPPQLITCPRNEGQVNPSDCQRLCDQWEGCPELGAFNEGAKE